MTAALATRVAARISSSTSARTSLAVMQSFAVWPMNAPTSWFTRSTSFALAL